VEAASYRDLRDILTRPFSQVMRLLNSRCAGTLQNLPQQGMEKRIVSQINQVSDKPIKAPKIERPKH